MTWNCYITSSLHSNDTVDVVLWPKFGNSSMSMREVILTSILYLTKKTDFLEGGLGLSLKIWG